MNKSNYYSGKHHKSTSLDTNSKIDQTADIEAKRKIDDIIRKATEEHEQSLLESSKPNNDLINKSSIPPQLNSIPSTSKQKTLQQHQVKLRPSLLNNKIQTIKTPKGIITVVESKPVIDKNKETAITSSSKYENAFLNFLNKDIPVPNIVPKVEVKTEMKNNVSEPIVPKQVINNYTYVSGSENVDIPTISIPEPQDSTFTIPDIPIINTNLSTTQLNSVNLINQQSSIQKSITVINQKPLINNLPVMNSQPVMFLNQQTNLLANNGLLYSQNKVQTINTNTNVVTVPTIQQEPFLYTLENVNVEPQIVYVQNNSQNIIYQSNNPVPTPAPQRRKPNLIWSNNQYYTVNRSETSYDNNDRFYPMSDKPIKLSDDDNNTVNSEKVNSVKNEIKTNVSKIVREENNDSNSSTFDDVFRSFAIEGKTNSKKLNNPPTIIAYNSSSSSSSSDSESDSDDSLSSSSSSESSSSSDNSYKNGRNNGVSKRNLLPSNNLKNGLKNFTNSINKNNMFGNFPADRIKPSSRNVDKSRNRKPPAKLNDFVNRTYRRTPLFRKKQPDKKNTINRQNKKNYTNKFSFITDNILGIKKKSTINNRQDKEKFSMFKNVIEKFKQNGKRLPNKVTKRKIEKPLSEYLINKKNILTPCDVTVEVDDILDKFSIEIQNTLKSGSTLRNVSTFRNIFNDSISKMDEAVQSSGFSSQDDDDNREENKQEVKVLYLFFFLKT